MRNCYTFKCDGCGKESRMRKSSFDKDMLATIEAGCICYCSKCKYTHERPSGPGYWFNAGDTFTVYPKIVPINELQEWQEGVERAKAIRNAALAAVAQQRSGNKGNYL